MGSWLEVAVIGTATRKRFLHILGPGKGFVNDLNGPQ